jgi:RNA-dependent RNA polymerase
MHFFNKYFIIFKERLRTKLQMPIPTNMGRSMFGVADDSGQLQYGQVFIRYTKNVSVKLPNENVKRAVLKGP